MEAAVIRERLHEYVNNSDEKLLKLMFALAKEYNDEDGDDYEFSENDIKLFDEINNKRLTGESIPQPWKEVKQMILNKR